tara:strand:- start:12187 stop:12696 length:510 start_codon:yes stop_codon:yes gene_type:complete
MAIIKTKKFNLRPYRKGDESSLQKNINDRSIYEFTLRIPYPYTMADAKKWVAAKNTKSKINFAIIIKDKVVGGVGFYEIKNYEALIGYWLARKYWNKGIMTEAVNKLTKYGFSKLKLRKITASVFLKNTASARVLQKTGYKRQILPTITKKGWKLILSVKYVAISNRNK